MRRDIVQLVDGRSIRPRNQMPVRVDGDLDRRVPELLLHVDDRFALLQQQRRERVPQVVDANLAEIGLLEDPREDVPDVPLVERGAFE